MARDREFEAWLGEMLQPLGPVTVKGMFGGAGLFLDGLMFGLIADGELFLKADEDSKAAYEAERQGPFTYERKGGKATVMSYWRLPERLLDEPDELVSWARTALGVARSAAVRKSVRQSPRRS